MPFHKNKCRVLLVDDHLAIRQELRLILSGYESVEIIGEAGDGKTAIELMGSCHPDVVILDMNMPIMDGIEAAKLIKTSWPTVAIIGVCVVQERYTMDAFLKAGALAVIPKDVAHEQLYAAIVRACPNLGQEDAEK